MLKFLSMPKQQAVAKFITPVATSKIMFLQEKGQQMQLDDDGGGWVPGLSGTDPNDQGNTIVDPSDDLLDSLRRSRAIHRKAIKVINDFILQAKINKQGSTPVATDAQKFSCRG
jgi:hypothetical protein